MDIPALSIMLATDKVKQGVDISVMKKSLDAMKVQGNGPAQMMQQLTAQLERSVSPYVGGNIDIKL